MTKKIKTAAGPVTAIAGGRKAKARGSSVVHQAESESATATGTGTATGAAGTEEPLSDLSSPLSDPADQEEEEEVEEMVVPAKQNNRRAGRGPNATNKNSNTAAKPKASVGKGKGKGRATPASGKRKRPVGDDGANGSDDEDEYPLAARIFEIDKYLNLKDAQAADDCHNIILSFSDTEADVTTHRHITYKAHRLFLIAQSDWFRDTLRGSTTRKLTLPTQLDDGNKWPVMDMAMAWFHEGNFGERDKRPECYHLSLLKLQFIAEYLRAPALLEAAIEKYRSESDLTIFSRTLTTGEFLTIMKDLVPAVYPVNARIRPDSERSISIRGFMMPSTSERVAQIRESLLDMAATRSPLMWTATDAERKEWTALMNKHPFFKTQFNESVQSNATISQLAFKVFGPEGMDDGSNGAQDGD